MYHKLQFLQIFCSIPRL